MDDEIKKLLDKLERQQDREDARDNEKLIIDKLMRGYKNAISGLSFLQRDFRPVNN